MNALVSTLRVIVLAALLILVAPWALNATTPTPSQPTRPAATAADGAPVVDYTLEPDLPSDAEYLKYRDAPPPMSDPLGDVIHAPPDGSPVEVWRDFEERQCTRWKREPPEYRRGTGCHVNPNPIGHGMVVDLPPARKADLDQQQRERTARFCERVIQAGFDSCKEIAHDGP